MTRRLTTRPDTPVASRPDRVADRIQSSKSAPNRTKSVRADRRVARPTTNAVETGGATMTYQQGFTSGPGM